MSFFFGVFLFSLFRPTLGKSQSSFQELCAEAQRKPFFFPVFVFLCHTNRRPFSLKSCVQI